MAVTSRARDGLRPVVGSLRLIGLRWLLSVAAALPAIAIGSGAIGDTLARRPYFAEAPDPLPLPHLGRFLGEVPGALWGALVVGAIAGWLANLMLTAAAVEILAPEPTRQRVRLVRCFFDTGSRFLFAYVRVAVTAIVAIAVGGWLICAIFGRLSDHGELARWTGVTLAIKLPILRAALLWSWASLVGVFAMWCRVILVADDRRRVRRLWSVVPRLWRRRPMSGLAFHWILSVASMSSGGVTLFAWRQSAAIGTLWLVAWQVVLGLQALLWHWRLRACRLVWASSGADDLRETADAPWGLLPRAVARIRR